MNFGAFVRILSGVSRYFTYPKTGKFIISDPDSFLSSASASSKKDHQLIRQTMPGVLTMLRQSVSSAGAASGSSPCSQCMMEEQRRAEGALHLFRLIPARENGKQEKRILQEMDKSLEISLKEHIISSLQGN